MRLTEVKPLIGLHFPKLVSGSTGILTVGVLTILTLSLALHLVHVCSITSLGATCFSFLEIHIHILEMPLQG